MQTTGAACVSEELCVDRRRRTNRKFMHRAYTRRFGYFKSVLKVRVVDLEYS